MKSFWDIDKLIAEVSCKPWDFVFDCIQCVREQSDKDGCSNSDHSWYLQARLLRRDTITGETDYGFGGKYFVSPHMTDGEIVKKCFVAARDYSEHEVREAFLWKGRRILGPHIDINALYEIAEVTEVRG